MNYRVWYSTEPFADFIIDNTELKNKKFVKKKMYESDANNAKNFHTMPDHIKKILYLDAPDLIVEIDHEPIFSVENNVPAFYIYPEAAIITRQNTSPKWDRINPLVFKALDDVMSIYSIPALLYYYPSDFRTHPNASASPNQLSKGILHDPNRNYSGSPLGTDPEMTTMFNAMNEIISVFEKNGIVKGREKLLGKRTVIARRTFMNQEYLNKGGNLNMSPLSATVKIPTDYLLNYLLRLENAKYSIGELLRSRKETIIYKVNAAFRGDPYPGALAAIDYLLCREGKSFEERKYNLVLAFSNVEVDEINKTILLPGTKGKVNDFVIAVQKSERKNILSKSYSEIANHEIPRYYMQVRYGSTYSKVKHIRVFSYFADAILFPDGALWRDA